MYQILLKIALTLTFLYIQPTLCMLMPFLSNQPHKERVDSYIKNKYPTVMKKMELSHKLKKKPLLLENSPFNFPELPDNIKFKIFASAEPRQKNQLQATCTFLHEKGSMQPPYVWEVINNTPLSIEEKDLSTLVLKAVVYEKTDILKKLLENNKKRDFIYEYTTSTNRDTLSFDIYQAAHSKTISNILKKHECTVLENGHQKTNIQLTPFITACFIEDDVMLHDVIQSYKNFSENEVLTAVQHLQNISNPKIGALLAKEFPIAYTIHNQNLVINEQNLMILRQHEVLFKQDKGLNLLIKAHEELKSQNYHLQRNLRDAQDNLDTITRRINIGYYDTPYVSYQAYPSYNHHALSII